jgi:hypothetical protein
VYVLRVVSPFIRKCLGLAVAGPFDLLQNSELNAYRLQQCDIHWLSEVVVPVTTETKDCIKPN